MQPLGHRAQAHHLLVVPDGVAPEDIEALVLSWFPESGVTHAEDRLRVQTGPGCAVVGPWGGDQLLPGWVAAVYLLEAPQQRGEPVPRELQGRGDLLDAFADGEPLGQERALLELALAIARRVGGAVRTAAGVLMTPAPRPDLVVYSQVWLHPDALVHVLEPHLPGLSLADPPTAPLPADARTGESLVTDESERRWLQAESEAYDLAALDEPQVSESYGASAHGHGEVFSVAVEAALGVPVVLAGTDLTGLIVYELRCYAEGNPSPAAVASLDEAGRALLAAVGGHVVDDDGFLIDLG